MGIVARDLIIGIIGGVGLFMWGLVTLGSGLQKAIGDRLRRVVKRFADKPLASILVGACMTVLFQSSSATAVVIVGLLNARLLTLGQALIVLMGANIGTTLIAQVFTFQASHLAMVSIGLGFALQYFATRRNLRYLGQSLLGLGMAFTGLNLLSNIFYSISQFQGFQTLLLDLNQHPFWGFIAGTVFTALLQSSNATIGLLQRLAQQSVFNNDLYGVLLPLTAAIPILMGSNVGSSLAAALACVGRSRTAKQAVLAYFLFNLVGSVILLFFVPAYAGWISSLTRVAVVWVSNLPGIFLGVIPRRLVEIEMISRSIVTAHTVFVLVNTLLWLPFVGLFVRSIRRIVPGQEEELGEGPRYLDEGMLGSPSVALDLAILEITHMVEITLQMLKYARQAFTKGSVHYIRDVEKKEELVDELQDKITLYLSTLLSRSLLTPAQSRKLAGLIHVVNDVERVADHANNIAGFAGAKLEEKLPFSELALNELELLFGKVEDILVLAVQSLRTQESSLAKKVLSRESAINKMEAELRQNHINRLNQGKCWPGSGVVYVELLNNLKRVSDHAVNIAQVVLKEEAIEKR